MTTPLLTAGTDYVYHAPAENTLRWLPENSIDLIVSDPPFNIGKAAWDTWESVLAFIAWLDAHLRQMRRVLKPNGSLYLFCATKYSADVEMVVRKHFNVLNSIRWKKDAGWHKKTAEEDLRGFFPASETIIFAEQWGADRPYSDALIDGNSTYWQACETAKVSIIGDYLTAEFNRAGATRKEIAALFPSATGGLTGCVSNWLLGYNVPTPEQYQKMREFLNAKGGEYLRREYEDLRREYEDLRREYEDLRREYEDLRRPFNGSPELPYTDVWEYETVNTYPGKHPCEKPIDMMRDIIRISSREGAIVLDPFCGSGSTLVAAKELKRQYIGGDFDAYWVERTNWRLQLPQQLELFLEATA